MAAAADNKWKKDAADQNFDYMFKLLIIGNSSVGKTSFLFRYTDDSFTSAFVSTVGIDFKVKTVFRNDKRIKLQIWDTGEYGLAVFFHNVNNDNQDRRSYLSIDYFLLIGVVYQTRKRQMSLNSIRIST